MGQKYNKKGKIYSIKYFLLVLLILILFTNLFPINADALNMEASSWIVKPKEEFYVTVTDNNGTLVQGATVEIQGGMSGETGPNGRVWLTAPSKKGLYLIIAEKGNYVVTNELKVDPGPAFWQESYFPIILGGICLISAILFVFFKEKKSIYERATQISKDNMVQKYTLPSDKTKPTKKQIPTKNISAFNQNNHQNKRNIYENPYYNKPIQSRYEKDSKVEEIRIRRPNKEREVVSVEEKKDVADKVIQDAKMKKRDDNWFQGNDDLKYEINKITGEVDEEQIDKWFEGVENLKQKIDEKVKKDKKKRKEEED